MLLHYVFFLDIVDYNNRAWTDKFGKNLVGIGIAEVAFPLLEFFHRLRPIRSLGRHVSRGDRESPELMGQILLVDPVSVDRRIDQTDAGQPGHVHSV